MAIAVRGLAPLLQVFDMPASLRFYRDALGFELVSSSEPGDDADWVWLRHGDAHLMLNAAYERGAVRRGAALHEGPGRLRGVLPVAGGRQELGGRS